MVIGQAREVLIPWIGGKVKIYLLGRFMKKEGIDAVIPQWERESKKGVYPGTFDEYSEIVLQYGYVTLFAAAFPLASLLAVINNIIEVRTDAFKLLDAYSRPEYKGAKSIGTWFDILEVLGVAAVITNCLLIGFTFAVVPKIFNFNFFQTFACIVVIEHIILFAKYLISVLIPDQPGWIIKELAKHAFIREETVKMIKGQKVAKRTFTKPPTAIKDDGSDDESSGDEKK